MFSCPLLISIATLHESPWSAQTGSTRMCFRGFHFVPCHNASCCTLHCSTAPLRCYASALTPGLYVHPLVSGEILWGSHRNYTVNPPSPWPPGAGLPRFRGCAGRPAAASVGNPKGTQERPELRPMRMKRWGVRRIAAPHSFHLFYSCVGTSGIGFIFGTLVCPVGAQVFRLLHCCRESLWDLTTVIHPNVTGLTP